MQSTWVIFPQQLFVEHPCLSHTTNRVYLVEDDLFFGDSTYSQCFHQQKLQLHFASMAYYYDYLRANKCDCEYLKFQPNIPSQTHLFAQLTKQNITQIHTVDPVDYILKQRLENNAKANNIEITWHKTPGFLNTQRQNSAYRDSKKRWFMADFYRHQRTRFNILMEGDKPISGRWSFDEENRKKIPKKEITNIPAMQFSIKTQYHTQAIERINADFSEHPGNGQTVIYPVTHEDAQLWLTAFFEQRFKHFGPFEDAIVEGQNWLYHSVLTPMLNIGLLTPKQVISQAIEYADEHEVDLASLEGFVRQIIGWREFMRATYSDIGVSMRTQNHWQHKRKIPSAFYTGDTGITPLDDTIKRIIHTGYCHHIERLMVLGGFFFLCEFEPDEIYRWFMDMFIDSYDWVMVPNVYAMSQHADGGQITTKPYFSGSNYIIKMSHYKKGAWSDIWDALYWRWIIKNHAELKKNHRWAMMCSQVDKMEEDKKNAYLTQANTYLSGL